MSELLTAIEAFLHRHPIAIVIAACAVLAGITWAMDVYVARVERRAEEEARRARRVALEDLQRRWRRDVEGGVRR